MLKYSEFCRVCQGVSHLEYNLKDDRYGCPGHYPVYLCNSCDHMFTHLEKPEVLSNIYQLYYPRKLITEKTLKDSAVHILKKGQSSKCESFKWVPPGAIVLELGCGMGEGLIYLQSIGCKAIGIDIDENVSLSGRVLNLDIRVGDIEEIELLDNQFDYVSMNQVLEHIQNPDFLFQKLYRTLRTSGKIIVAFPNTQSIMRYLFGRSWIHWHVPYHLNFYTHESLQKLAAKAGFKIESAKYRTPSDWMYYQLLHVLTRHKETGISQFWSGNMTQLSLVKKAGIKVVTLLYKIKFLKMIGHIIDCFRLGDNVIYTLQKVSV